MRAHAKLSASGAHRWMSCPASVRVESDLPDRTSPFAQEGSAAHELAERCLSTDTDATAHVGAVFDDYPDYPVTDEMARYVQTYVDYVRELPGHHFIEQRVDFSEWVPGGFGTSDAISIHDGTAYVVDLKYGRGVTVDAERNPQAMLYALGVLNDYSYLFDIQQFCVAVVQPRLGHISEWSISREDLLAWAEQTQQHAIATERDDAPFVPGESQCRFCKAKPTCRALAEHNLQLATEGFESLEVHREPKKPDTLTNTDIAALLPHLDILTSWAKSVESHAQSVLETGGEIPGYKLVEGRSVRKWRNEEDAEAALRKRLKVGEIFTKKLITPPAAEKLLGKTHAVISEHVIKPAGRPTIAPDSDKRPAVVIDLTAGFAPTA